MFRRLCDLYNKGGSQELLTGIKRYNRIRRRNALAWLLRRFNDPISALHKYIDFQRRIPLRQYSTADPFKIIHIDPAQIQFQVYNVPTAWGRVAGGSWERIPFEEITVHGVPFHESLVMHFDNMVPWEDTPLYTARMENIGNDPRGFSSCQEVKSHFDALDNVFRKIKTEGYKIQAELLSENGDLVRNRNNDEIDPILNEVGVNIDQNGDLLWSRCGRHRLSISKILGLDNIPVQVRTRHSCWEQVRIEIKNVSSPKELSNESQSKLNHPDLMDVVSKNWVINSNNSS